MSKKRDNSKNRQKGNDNIRKKFGIDKTIVIKEHKRVDQRLLKLRRKQKAFLAVLFGLAFNLPAACKKFNLAPLTHHHWMKNDPWYAGKYEEKQDLLMDEAEAKLFEHIFANGSEKSLHYYLDRKGTKRGYGPKPLVAIQNNKNTILMPGQSKPIKHMEDVELDLLIEKLESRLNGQESTKEIKGGEGQAITD